MKGHLCDPSGEKLAELPKSDFHAFVNAGQIQCGTQINGELLFTLQWNGQSCSWQLAAHHPNLFIDGSPAGFSRKHLPNRTLFQAHGASLLFIQELDVPLYNGKPADQIDISPAISPLTIGRGEGKNAQSSRICLDPESRIISTEHAHLTWMEGSWLLTNLGRSGTELNGSRISEADLVYGDRIRIGSYLLEFRGDRICRIDHLASGKVQARDIGVTVKDRETKKPKHIVRGVNIDVEPGEFVGILGGSGQGKSTLLNALCGISGASEGVVTIGGVSVMELISQKPGHVGFVPQDDIVHRELTIDEALRSSARLRVPLKGAELKKLIDRTIDLLGLSDYRSQRIDKLSGGQRKRVSIAIELLSKPDVLFLDEPSSGLDPATEASLMRLLQQLALTQLTIICTTHVLQNAYLFNRLLFIHGGRLIFAGNTDEARTYFLADGNVDGSQSDLEKIYPTVLDSPKSAEEWESQYLEYCEAPLALPVAKQDKGSGGRSIPWFKKLAVLLTRQWHILRAERLNIAFLALQVFVIGLVISWISDEPGFRMFLGLIAAMWFGCSNGAQQIVGELPIFFRERVCGLGNATYLASKLIFHGTVSVLQALVLFLVIIVASKTFHPDEWDSARFHEQLKERESPILADFSEPEDGGAFIPVGEEDWELDFPEEESTPTSEAAAPPEKPAGPAALWLMEPLVRLFYLKENVLDSGPKPLVFEDGSPILGEDKIQRTTDGMEIWTVITTSIGLRLLAFATVAFVGVVIGLLVSSLVNTTIQAVMWIPLLLIPQILFGGYVIPLIEMDAMRRGVAHVFPSFAGQRLVDLSHVYGRRLPRIANETRHPVFLSPEGEKTLVEWEEDGRQLTENYDKFSEINRSWQNLAVKMENVGERKKEKERGSRLGSYVTPSSVESRKDVRYKHGTVYANPAPGWQAITILASWLVGCLFVTFISLRARKIR